MKYAGIDWATDIHFVALLDGMQAEEWQVAHEPAAIQEGLLARLERAGGPQEVWVAIESGAPLVTDQLLQAGYRVYPINPKQADRFRDRFSVAGAKDDRRDALVLAHALRTDAQRLRPLDPESPLTEELRLRDRARTRLVVQRTRESNQLRQTIARYYPALLRVDRPMHAAFFLALLQAYPEPVVGGRARAPRLARLLREHRVRKLGVEDLQSILREDTFYVPDHIVEAYRDEALHLARQIILLNEQIAVADERLRALFEKHPDRDLLRSLPGLGVCLAIRVMAELGDHRARSGDPTSVQAFAGTAPVTRRSGKRGVYSITMRRGCNRVLQAALFHMARCSTPRSAWAAAYLVHTRARGVSYAKAVRALSNKWVKIIVAVLSKREPYDEELHVRHLRQNNVPWLPAFENKEKIPA